MSALDPEVGCHESSLDSGEWPLFFGRFSTDHADAAFSMEYTSPDSGPVELVRDSPLMGITASTEHADQMRIEIIFGGEGDQYLSHTIDRPSRVIECSADGADQGWLQIESRDGEVVTMRWKEPA